jgi:EAL domain-containing protein (putative c-di-GMP-specific phosphodiesterase class I)
VGRWSGTRPCPRFAQLPVRAPDAWFAEAAILGLGVELELTALGMALEQLDRLPPTMYLSVNASVEAIMSRGFPTAMRGVPAERIVIEVTEHTPVSDYAAFIRSTDALRSMGIRLAFDDAGAGFSSFNHVLNLRPDVIKLDISLIRGIDRDPDRQALARALLDFGSEAFGTAFVAEGIETAGELSTLRTLGFPNGQGFILGRRPD